MTDMPIPADYAAWLADLKARITGARSRAALPEPLDTCLPSIETIEAELSTDVTGEDEP